MTDPSTAEKMQKLTEATQRFAAAWSAEITEAFKPFSAAVERIQKRPSNDESAATGEGGGASGRVENEVS